MITFYYRNKKQKRVQVIPEYKKGAWVCVETPNEEEIAYLIESFNLEAGLLKDALDEHEVPRLDVENGVVYVFTRFVTEDEGNIITTPLLIAVKKNVLISVSPQRFPRIEKLLGEKHHFQTTENSSLFIQLFAQVGHTYNHSLAAISKKVQGNTVHLEKIKNRDIVQFITFENVLNDFILALVRSNNILNNLQTKKTIALNDEEKDLIEDLSLYNSQLVQIANENLRTIVNIREAYSTIMTTNLNRVIKLFTSLTVILTLPTITASIYGMNVALPFGNSPYAFLVIVGFTLAIVVTALVIFGRKDWL